MFKDAPASESTWDDGPYGGGASASLDWRSAPVTVALRAPESEAPPAAERPAKPLAPDVERGPPPAGQQDKSGAPSAGAGCAGIRSWLC